MRRFLQPRYSLNWIIGRYRADGFVWHVRGSEYPMNHEDWLRRKVRDFYGKLFVDIGANVGTWAIRASKFFEKIIAFEPDPMANRILRINVRLNGLKNTKVFRAAVSNVDGFVTMQYVNLRNLSNVKTYKVPTVTLDSLNLSPTLIKIDTEGNELPILQGAVHTLRRRPRLVIETHSPRSVGEVGELLESYKYSIREIRRLNRRNELQTWLLCD